MTDDPDECRLNKSISDSDPVSIQREIRDAVNAIEIRTRSIPGLVKAVYLIAGISVGLALKSCG